MKRWEEHGSSRVEPDGTAHITRVIPPPHLISPEGRAYLATPPWGAAAPDPNAPMWAAREQADAALRMIGDMAAGHYEVSVEETQIAGVRCHRVRSSPDAGKACGRVLINLHGGGFVLGSGSLVEAIPIARMTGIPVIAVDYRLAPEYPYPAAVEDVIAVYRAVLAHHDASAIGIYGASAGGILTGQVQARIAHEGLPPPGCLGMFTAAGDLSHHGESAQLFALSGFWGELLRPTDHPLSEVRAYLGGADPRDPLVSPIHADLSRFPPTLLVTGTRDALLSGTCALHLALRRAGADAELLVFEAMPHAHWYAFHLPESQQALALMSDFFERKLRRTRA